MGENINAISVGAMYGGTAEVVVTGGPISAGDMVILQAETMDTVHASYSAEVKHLDRGFTIDAGSSADWDICVTFIGTDGSFVYGTWNGGNYDPKDVYVYANNVFGVMYSDGRDAWYKKFDPATNTIVTATADEAVGTPNIANPAGYKTKTVLSIYDQGSSSRDQSFYYNITATTFDGKPCGLLFNEYVSFSSRSYASSGGSGCRVIDTNNGPVLVTYLPLTSSYSLAKYQFDSNNQICPLFAYPISLSPDVNESGVFIGNHYPFIGKALSSGEVGSVIRVENHGLYYPVQ